MRVKMTFAVLALAALALALPASSVANGSRTVHVDPGQSIQDAVDNAKPGTTIKLGEGTFHESVSIAKDDISIVGEGRKKTLIAFEGAGTPPECGICVSPTQQGGTVEDVHISRLAVSGFGFGILFSDSEDISVQRTHLYDNHEYGVAAFGSTEGVYSRNIAPNNGEAGIYVGSSPEAKSVIYKNVTWGNLFGIFVRDAAHGQVLKNKSFGNCVGMIFLETGDPSAVNHDWLVKGNNATANNLSDATLCAGEGGPPVSGVGIAIAGARDLEVVHNGAFGNRSGIANSLLSAGIALIDTTDDGGGPPTGNTIAFNTAFGNQPVDLFAEGHVAANRFFANDCLTSQPDGLCEDPDGDGEHGDDDDDRGDDHPKGDGDHHKGDHKKHKKSKKHKSKKHRKHKQHKKHDRDDD